MIANSLECPMSLKSLIDTGTKVWLDGVEPDHIQSNRALGITGATSNPTIISRIIEKGQFEKQISELIERGLNDQAIVWWLDDELCAPRRKSSSPCGSRPAETTGTSALSWTR
jgi:transaldolase